MFHEQQELLPALSARTSIWPSRPSSDDHQARQQNTWRFACPYAPPKTTTRAGSHWVPERSPFQAGSAHEHLIRQGRTLHCEHMPNCDSSSSAVGAEQLGQSGREGNVTPSTPPGAGCAGCARNDETVRPRRNLVRANFEPVCREEAIYTNFPSGAVIRHFRLKPHTA